MQPSFCWTNPFLTGERQKKSQNADIAPWLGGRKILLPLLLFIVFLQMYSFRIESCLVISTRQARSGKKIKNRKDGVFPTYLSFHPLLFVSWTLPLQAAAFSSRLWPPAPS